MVAVTDIERVVSRVLQKIMPVLPSVATADLCDALFKTTQIQYLETMGFKRYGGGSSILSHCDVIIVLTARTAATARGRKLASCFLVLYSSAKNHSLHAVLFLILCRLSY